MLSATIAAASADAIVTAGDVAEHIAVAPTDLNASALRGGGGGHHGGGGGGHHGGGGGGHHGGGGGGHHGG